MSNTCTLEDFVKLLYQLLKPENEERVKAEVKQLCLTTLNLLPSISIAMV